MAHVMGSGFSAVSLEMVIGSLTNNTEEQAG
jgi:hypothetical protein